MTAGTGEATQSLFLWLLANRKWIHAAKLLFSIVSIELSSAQIVSADS
jgi:hypothetical protein